MRAWRFLELEFWAEEFRQVDQADTRLSGQMAIEPSPSVQEQHGIVPGCDEPNIAAQVGEISGLHELARPLRRPGRNQMPAACARDIDISTGEPPQAHSCHGADEPRSGEAPQVLAGDVLEHVADVDIEVIAPQRITRA